MSETNAFKEGLNELRDDYIELRSDSGLANKNLSKWLISGGLVIAGLGAYFINKRKRIMIKEETNQPVVYYSAG